MEGKEGVFRGMGMPFAASGPRGDTVARCQIITTSAFPAHKSETAKFRSGFSNHFGQHERAAAFICEVIGLQQKRAIRQARDGTRRVLRAGRGIYQIRRVA